MKAKIPAKETWLFLGERLSKLLIFLSRFISGNLGSTVWSDLPTLIRKGGCHRWVRMGKLLHLGPTVCKDTFSGTYT